MRLPHALLLGALLWLAPHVTAKDYQQCVTSSSCTIGEFLYNDDYSALPSQSCTLTAKYPDGTAFLTSQPMTSRADGWYSYDATIGTTTGLYTATMCCVPSDGTLCLDKSFEVKAPAASPSTLTAADVWNYSSRSLTSFGSLVSEIWNSSTRSLTTFGTIIADITGLSDPTSPSSPPSLQSIAEEQETQRQLLEQLVNEPIVSLSLEEGVSIPNLESKLTVSRKLASNLYDTVSSSKSRLMILDAKWASLGQNAAVSELSELINLIDTPDSLVQLTRAWDHPTITSLNTDFNNLKTSLTQLLTSTNLTKTTLAPASLLASLNILNNLETTLGDTTNGSSEATLYGHLAFVSERDATLQSESRKLAGLIDNLDGSGYNTLTQTIATTKSRLLALNQYPGGDNLANPAKISSEPKLNLKNTLFSLQALIGLNRQLLAINAGDPVRSLWLEEGSIIFRAVITNPSTIIAQTVPLKFYLPHEVKTTDIITLDPDLTTTYDSKEEALYAHGSFVLQPKETRIVYVEIEDIWQLTSAEIESLRNQATTLLKPLEKTAYYSQAITLKSDIDSTLSKVVLTTSQAVTPENRIRVYREGKLELTKVHADINRLEDLVAQASGTGSLFGFVGGVQTVAVWGIILVIVAGFIFLTLYFKKLGITPPNPSPEPVVDNPPLHLSPLEVPSVRPAWQIPTIVVTSVILTAGITFLLTRPRRPQPAPVINQVTTTPTPVPTEITIQHPKDVLGTTTPTSSPSATLTVPPNSSVNIRNRPNPSADILMSIKQTLPIYVFQSVNEWSQIGLTPNDQPKGYWVHSEFVSPLMSR